MPHTKRELAKIRKAIEKALKSMCSDITQLLAAEVQQREELASLGKKADALTALSSATASGDEEQVRSALAAAAALGLSGADEFKAASKIMEEKAKGDKVRAALVSAIHAGDEAAINALPKTPMEAMTDVLRQQQGVVIHCLCLGI